MKRRGVKVRALGQQKENDDNRSDGAQPDPTSFLLPCVKNKTMAKRENREGHVLTSPELRPAETRLTMQWSLPEGTPVVCAGSAGPLNGDNERSDLGLQRLFESSL